MPGRHFQLAAVKLSLLVPGDSFMLRSRRSLIVEHTSFLPPTIGHASTQSIPCAATHAARSRTYTVSLPHSPVCLHYSTSTFKSALSINNKTYYRVASRAGPNVVLPSKTDWLTSGNHRSFHSWMEIPLRDALKFALRKALGNHTCDPGGMVLMTKRHPQLTLH